MFLNKRYRYWCILEAVLLLLSLFSGTTALFPNGTALKSNGQPCLVASECESGACFGLKCVDKIALGGNCTLEAPCASLENTTCNFQAVDVDVGGVCELAKQAGEVCSNDFPQSRCIEPQLACVQRRSLAEPPKCLIVVPNGQQRPDTERFVCGTKFVIHIRLTDTFFCSDGEPGDICNPTNDHDCRGTATCFECSRGGSDCIDKCLCIGSQSLPGDGSTGQCVKRPANGEDCFGAGSTVECLPGTKCLIVRKKCTDGNLGSPCTVNIDCGKVIGSELECSGGFCVKRGGIGQPCTSNGFGLGLIQGSCANGLLCSKRRGGTCGCRPVLGCP